MEKMGLLLQFFCRSPVYFFRLLVSVVVLRALQVSYYKIVGVKMIFKELNGTMPQTGRDCFFAENAVIVGDNVTVGHNAIVLGCTYMITCLLV